ncbi:hypothetical protein M422DRAFT_248843 [Sphaerobolus stellatus SS14]|nr:hypothetical protein M422DRAFT_248843 [Sphaerobolus stellatus SS14]
MARDVEAVKRVTPEPGRVAESRIEEAILEEFDEGASHPEEQQDLEDQPEENDQQYCFNDDEYEMRYIDNEVVGVNAVIKVSGYNDHCRLCGIQVWEAETDLRVSEVVQTGGKLNLYLQEVKRMRLYLFSGIYWEQRSTAF